MALMLMPAAGARAGLRGGGGLLIGWRAGRDRGGGEPPIHAAGSWPWLAGLAPYVGSLPCHRSARRPATSAAKRICATETAPSLRRLASSAVSRVACSSRSSPGALEAPLPG